MIKMTWKSVEQAGYYREQSKAEARLNHKTIHSSAASYKDNKANIYRIYLKRRKKWFLPVTPERGQGVTTQLDKTRKVP